MAEGEISSFLIVEDDPGHARLLDIFLGTAGFHHERTFVQRGEAAVAFLFDGGSETVRERRRNLLIFLDLNLPGMHGYDVLRRIRSERETRTLPVVVITSSCDPAERARALDNGANAFLEKPPSTERLREVIAGLMGPGNGA